ncbi:uncharacterized protein LOC111263673 [Varroa jacobsoni]|uniref:uncharacterized protein LOC111263673 n=1 Tax=Varroa jacobsoni TaxID=62625 RepID=UPI000BF90C78|nr:uncharacterized protein LOC111263673 [Varroa jacobsoni]
MRLNLRDEHFLQVHRTSVTAESPIFALSERLRRRDAKMQILLLKTGYLRPLSRRAPVWPGIHEIRKILVFRFPCLCRLRRLRTNLYFAVPNIHVKEPLRKELRL